LFYILKDIDIYTFRRDENLKYLCIDVNNESNHYLASIHFKLFIPNY